MEDARRQATVGFENVDIASFWSWRGGVDMPPLKLETRRELGPLLEWKARRGLGPFLKREGGLSILAPGTGEGVWAWPSPGS